MIATKCDICGTYIDKCHIDMPYVHFGYDSEDVNKREVCYECYSGILNMFHMNTQPWMKEMPNVINQKHKTD